MDTASPARLGRSPLRWSPLGGLAFVVGVVVILVSPAGDETGDTTAEVVRYAEDNEGWTAFVTLFGLLSLLLLGWFTAGLRRRLADAGAHDEGVVAAASGVVFVVLFFLALTVWSAPLFGITDGDPTEADKVATASTYLAIDDIGWVMFGGAGVAAGVMAIAASLGARRTSLVPAWAAWVGVALGVVSLATIAFVGLFAWLAWVLLASLTLLARR